LLRQLLSILDDAVRAGGSLPLDVARIVLAGQPAMAPLWHACAAAVAEAASPGTFARTRAEMERAPRALVRAASLALRELLTDDRTPRLLTLSYSSSVAHVLGEVARSTELRVVCAESRPRFEGRQLATELAQTGITVTVVVDAALTTCLSESSAVVMGADAILDDRWINKVGSFGLAAAAALRGVPVYVISARNKCAPRILALHLTPPLHDADEVWPEHPAQIVTLNPYFEPVPSDLATLFLSDAGPIAPADLPHVVDHRSNELSLLLNRLSS
jgi:ribose 1,5-bisphosphate isomerase